MTINGWQEGDLNGDQKVLNPDVGVGYSKLQVIKCHSIIQAYTLCQCQFCGSACASVT